MTYKKHTALFFLFQSRNKSCGTGRINCEESFGGENYNLVSKRIETDHNNLIVIPLITCFIY
jgi:hypothetical protein